MHKCEERKTYIEIERKIRKISDQMIIIINFTGKVSIRECGQSNLNQWHINTDMKKSPENE